MSFQFDPSKAGINGAKAGGELKEKILNIERSCYKCEHRHFCFIRRNMDTLIEKAHGFFDFDGPKGYQKTPLFWQDLFKVLAGTCFEFKPTLEE